MTIPIAQLSIESLQTNPPRPIGYHVIVNGHTVAILTPETVEQAYAEYLTLLATMRALLAAEAYWREKAARLSPMNRREACEYCGVKIFLSDEGEWVRPHAPDCPWLLAQA